MSWISIVLYIIINAPKIISIIKQIIDLLKKAPAADKELVRGQLTAAIQEHMKDKDDEKLEKVCVGLGCAPQMVK